MEYYKLKQGTILTYNQKKCIKEKRYYINIVPVWEWILTNKLKHAK